MKIGDRSVGQGLPVLVIAEIGVNHDGSVERALNLVHLARVAGANAVKLQVFTADRLLHSSARFAEYQVDRTNASDPVALLRQYELSDSALKEIVLAIRSAGLIPIATPFSPEDVDRVKSIGVDAIKIASPDLVNKVLLEKVAGTGLPVIFSTGASTEDEIDAATSWIWGRIKSFALLHCISSYPTVVDDVSLNWIGRLSRHGVPVGYSDHSTELIAGAISVAHGATIIEKHLTYDIDAIGPDHSASFDGAEFSQYVHFIRLAERMRVEGTRKVLECEYDVRSVSRQSLVSRVRIAKGEIIHSDMLTTQRPGTGISSWQLDSVTGKSAVEDIPAGTMLKPAMIEGYHG